ncbi:hypothetical protein B0H34DRAFT_662490 [Crassisporium funariophilum]|nr:hypothetical protein B0H34DRAFT_662490 [Crassisporium funariophilum]
MDCALFGSLASSLYGNTRPPNDVDIVVFPPAGLVITAEWLKRLIVKSDEQHFFLAPAKDSTATYKLLYFRVDSTLTPRHTFHLNRCKVDLLLPGTMHLPYLPPRLINIQDGLPVIPFSLLLLQKLQGWDDHRGMAEPHKYRKHTTDAADVQNLLKLQHVVALRFSQPWNERILFSDEFMSLSVRRVRQFCSFYSDCTEEWRRLGFDI